MKMRLFLERRQGYGGWLPRLTNVEDRAPRPDGFKWVAAFSLPEGPVEVWVADSPPSARDVAEGAAAWHAENLRRMPGVVEHAVTDSETDRFIELVDRWVKGGKP